MTGSEQAWADDLAQQTALRLTTRRLGRELRALGRTTSTMAEAAEWAAGGAPDGAVVVATTQTAGRGRQGRTWQDRPGSSLLCSVVLRGEVPASLLGLLPLAAGVAAGAAIEGAAGVAATLKWPNDVLVGGRKVAGVLAEGRAGALVVGLGVNVGRGAAPVDAGRAATSLDEAAGRPVAAADVLAQFLNALEELIDGIASDAGATVRERWEARMHGRGRPVVARGGGAAVEGIALGLALDGALRVGTAEGERPVYAGDVTLGGDR